MLLRLLGRVHVRSFPVSHHNTYQVVFTVDYYLPINRKLYMSSIGRCRTFGMRGVAINLVKPDETSVRRGFEQYYSTRIDEVPTNLMYIMQ